MSKRPWFISIILVGCVIGLSGCSKNNASGIGKKAAGNNQKVTTKEGLSPLQSSDVIEVIDPKTNLAHEVLYPDGNELQNSQKETGK